MVLVARLELMPVARGVEEELKEIAEAQVLVAHEVGLSALGTLQRAPDGLAQ